ncbi:MAG: hypothetical protein HQL82_11410 [Magnetococcales bacterium]|nr:hypothetical protein [Magnetococcales bacterium]
MDGGLVGRRILLISPQPWDHLFISKHHYAQELARDNRVWFLDPPEAEGPPGGVRVSAVPGEPNLWRVRHRLFFPRQLRFHWPWLYRRLIARQARRIVRALPEAPDLVWCFDFNLFPDLRAFGAPTTLYHPVDPLSLPSQVAIGRSADLILSVSRTILAHFSGSEFQGRTLWVNHGLCREFAALARQDIDPARPPGPPRVGYFGNLDRPMLDLELWERAVTAHPGVAFHFWGAFDPAGPFARRLAARPNVACHGTAPKGHLVTEVAAMDLFLLLYRADHPEYDRSNAHKILEYLATGKVILSVPIDTYRDAPDLLEMLPEGGEAALPERLGAVLEALDHHNSPARMARRRARALECTYEHHLRRIAQRLRPAAGFPHP